jgi:hypothetical protein
MSNTGLYCDQAIEQVREMNENIAEIQAGIAKEVPGWTKAKEAGKKCHDDLKAFNDTFFPSIGIHV